MDKNFLCAKMKMHGDTQADLAEALGISLGQTNAKINETRGAGFTQREIFIIKSRYQLTAEEVDKIFFGEKVS